MPSTLEGRFPLNVPPVVIMDGLWSIHAEPNKDTMIRQQFHLALIKIAVICLKGIIN
jgi:hypothetical protein